MDNDHVLKKIEDIIELADVKSAASNASEEQNQDDKPDDSNTDSTNTKEYEFDRTAPSYFMSLAEQESSRQASFVNEASSSSAAAPVAVDGEQLDEKLKDLESAKDDSSEETVNEDSETEPEPATAAQPINDAASEPPSVKSKSSVISFEHKAYDEAGTFKMQPEIVGVIPKKRVEWPPESEKLVFGSPKHRSKEYCECESAVPHSRSYGVLANVLLKTVSEYSVNRQMPLEEIKSQISMAQIRNEISSEEVLLLETAVDQVEKYQELATVDPENDSGMLVLTEYISKLFAILKNILFSHNESQEACTAEQLSVAPSAIKDGDEKRKMEEEKIAARLRQLLYDSHMQIRKEYESKLCACGNEEEDLLMQKDEMETEQTKGILRALRRTSELAKSHENVTGDARSVENVIKSMRSQISVDKSENGGLHKFKNVEDLSAIGVNASPSFVLRTSDIEESHTKFSKFPKTMNAISVMSIPSVHISPTVALKSSLLPRYLSKKGEDMSNAVIHDLNDDGYVNLPKVPSHALSTVSSSAWIDENASFIVEERTPTKITVERVSLTSDRIIPQTTLISSTEQPTTSSAASDQTHATAADTQQKPKGAFRKCRCFLRRLSKPFARSSKDGKKQ